MYVDSDNMLLCISDVSLSNFYYAKVVKDYFYEYFIIYLNIKNRSFKLSSCNQLKNYLTHLNKLAVLCIENRSGYQIMFLMLIKYSF